MAVRPSDIPSNVSRHSDGEEGWDFELTELGLFLVSIFCQALKKCIAKKPSIPELRREL